MAFGRKGLDQTDSQSGPVAEVQRAFAEAEDSRLIALSASQASPELAFPAQEFGSALQGLEKVREMLPILTQQVGRADPAFIAEGVEQALGMLKICRIEFDQFTGEMLAREQIFLRDRRQQSASQPDRSKLHCELLDLGYERLEELERKVGGLCAARDGWAGDWPRELDCEAMVANCSSFKTTLERYNELLLQPGATFSKPMAAALSRLVMVLELSVNQAGNALASLAIDDAVDEALGMALNRARSGG